MFLNTRLLGVPIPFHRNFEEVNLRFYVKYRDQSEWKRGVVFIREIVPKPALTFVANSLYKEHYKTMKMGHQWEEKVDGRLVKYQWQAENKWHSIKLEAASDPIDMIKDSEEEFIAEHYWGYTRDTANSSYEYEVTHPKWQVYPVLSHEINVDFEAVYGPDFAFLNDRSPKSVMLAEGSEISVENKRRITS